MTTNFVDIAATAFVIFIAVAMFLAIVASIVGAVMDLIDQWEIDHEDTTESDVE